MAAAGGVISVVHTDDEGVGARGQSRQQIAVGRTKAVLTADHFAVQEHGGFAGTLQGEIYLHVLPVAGFKGAHEPGIPLEFAGVGEEIGLPGGVLRAKPCGRGRAGERYFIGITAGQDVALVRVQINPPQAGQIDFMHRDGSFFMACDDMPYYKPQSNFFQ